MTSRPSQLLAIKHHVFGVKDQLLPRRTCVGPSRYSVSLLACGLCSNHIINIKIECFSHCAVWPL